MRNQKKKARRKFLPFEKAQKVEIKRRVKPCDLIA